MTQKPSYEELENRVKELELIVSGTKQSDGRLLSILSEAERLANFGSWEWDMVPDVWTMSKNWMNIHGCKDKVLNAEKLRAIAHPDDIDRIQKAFDQCRKDGVFYQIEHRIIKQDTKEVRYIRAYGRVQRDSKAKPVKLYGAAIDITERKQAEQEISEANDFKNLIIEASPVGVFVFEESGPCVFANYAAEKIVGASSEESLKLNFREMETYKKNGIFADMEEVLRTGRVIRREIRTINTFGKDVWFSGVLSVFRSHGEKHILFLFHDIMERKQAEIELKNKQYYLSKAQEIGNIGTWELDIVNNKLVWTDETFRIFGGRPGSVVNYEVFISKVHPEDRAYVDSEWQAAMQGKPYDIEHRILLDGETTWVREKADVTFDENGLALSAIGVAQDITLRKQAEITRRELELQIRQKYKMEAIGVMATGMAHNFNNNLAIILGNLEMSKLKLPQGSNAGVFLDYAKTAVVRSRDLVKQIMTYSRKEPSSASQFLLSLLLKEAHSLLKSTIPTSIELSEEIGLDCRDAYISGDSSQIQECLINLCNNAVHAMHPKGELRLSLSRVELKQKDIPAHSDCLAGDYLCLSVRDNGCGIPDDIKEKIFDPFFTTKGLHEGTGMGLSSVKGIVEKHHGLLSFESEVGHGTTFQLYFPVVDQHQKEDVNKVLELKKGTEAILYVDDDDMIAELGGKMLAAMGYQVTVKTDSLEALELFKADMEKFDLIITDQTMPKLTGKELIQKIKTLRLEIPIILCTGYDDKGNEEDARESGISAFLMKPVEFNELSQVVRGVLDKN